MYFSEDLEDTPFTYTGFSFEIDFLQKFPELFCQFVIWAKFGNSGKSLDNFWISCQVMADMEKFYDNLMIINLY